MRIFQLVTKRQFRGAEVASAAFSEEFIRLSHEVTFCGLYPPPNKSLEVIGADNVDINASSGFFSLTGFFRLLKLISNKKPDILHANGSDTLKYLIAVKLFRPSSIVVYRNISLISHWCSNNPVKLAFYKWLFRRVDFITSVGETSMSDFVNLFGFSKKKIKVIKRGIDFLEYTPLNDQQKTKAGIPVGRQVLIHVGNFSPEKDHAFLIDCFVKIKENNPAVVLMLLGEGELMPTIRNKVESLGLGNEVIFLGMQQEIGPYLAMADLILLTSKIEGVPGVLLEAACHRVPSVAFDVGGVREFVKPGETGELVSEENKDQFAVRVNNLLSNPTKRKNFGENAARLVREEHLLARNAMDFIQVFKDLIDKIKK